MNTHEAADTNAKIERLMDTIAEQQATIERLQRGLASVLDYCTKNENDCDPFCCREFLVEVRTLAEAAQKP